jgi:hypothetical protein
MMSEFLLEVIREVIQRIIVVIILMCIWAVLEFELRALRLHEALHQLELYTQPFFVCVSFLIWSMLFTQVGLRLQSSCKPGMTGIHHHTQ